jgi:predicted RNA-binding Zn ribbon-like protein
MKVSARRSGRRWPGNSSDREAHHRADGRAQRQGDNGGCTQPQRRLRSHLARHPAAGATLTRELTELRAVVADAVTRPSRQTLAQGEHRIVTALRHSTLERSGADPNSPYQWRVSALDEQTIALRLALELQTLLTTTPGRVGICADKQCQWVFLDTSRGRNRRWCDSRDCGNRHRVRRYHERAR